VDAYTEKLYAREANLRVGIILLRQQLGLAAGAPPQSAPKDVPTRLSALRAHRAEHRRLLQQLHASTQRPFGGGEPFDWERFRSVADGNLPPDWSALLYHRLDEALVIFHVTSKEVTTLAQLL
jgi:hypothetical protein